MTKATIRSGRQSLRRVGRLDYERLGVNSSCLLYSVHLYGCFFRLHYYFLHSVHQPSSERISSDIRRHTQLSTVEISVIGLHAVDITVVTSTTENTRKHLRRLEILLPFHYPIVSTFIFHDTEILCIYTAGQTATESTE